jgi:hypothetical protein
MIFLSRTTTSLLTEISRYGFQDIAGKELSSSLFLRNSCASDAPLLQVVGVRVPRLLCFFFHYRTFLIIRVIKLHYSLFIIDS